MLHKIFLDIIPRRIIVPILLLMTISIFIAQINHYRRHSFLESIQDRYPATYPLEHELYMKYLLFHGYNSLPPRYTNMWSIWELRDELYKLCRSDRKTLMVDYSLNEEKIYQHNILFALEHYCEY